MDKAPLPATVTIKTHIANFSNAAGATGEDERLVGK